MASFPKSIFERKNFKVTQSEMNTLKKFKKYLGKGELALLNNAENIKGIAVVDADMRNPTFENPDPQPTVLSPVFSCESNARTKELFFFLGKMKSWDEIDELEVR